MSYLDTLLFGVYPYLAGAVFLLGSLARSTAIRSPGKPIPARCSASKNMRWASNLFHVGILLLFLGHFVGLLTPPEVFHALGVSAGAKQISGHRRR
jgi:nitrate reductase gamma subunit